MTSGIPDKKIYGLDFLRAIAVLLVFVWHFRRYGIPDWLFAVSEFGWTGVDLFFVLSAYLIGTQLLKKVESGTGISVQRFYSRRFFRIIPAYGFVLILYFSVPAFNEWHGISPLWKFLTFTMNFGLNYQTSGTFSHAWSLCVEEQFYLLFPLLATLFVKLKAKPAAVSTTIAVLFASGMLVRMYCWNTFVSPLYTENVGIGRIANTYAMHINYPTYNRIDGLLVGILIALVFTFRPAWKDRVLAKGNSLLLTGLLLLVAAYFVCAEPYSLSAAVFGYPLISIAYGFVVLAALSPSCLINRFHSKFLTILAVLSYSFYLTHKQLNYITHLLTFEYNLDINLKLLLCFTVSLAGSILLYFTIEKPFLKFRDKIV